MKSMGSVVAIAVLVFVVAGIVFLMRGSKPVETDALLAQIMQKYPRGWVRRGSLGEHKDAAIKEILIFDSDDHWLFIFMGLRARGQPFELSVRTAKNSPEESPPDWPVEPATRVANAIAEGSEGAPGATWKLGAFSDAMPRSAGFLTLLDIQFGELKPARLLQLVPVTEQEAALTGDEKRALLERLYKDRGRMIGVRL